MTTGLLDDFFECSSALPNAPKKKQAAALDSIVSSV
jgi:hypothetical protein